MTAEDSFLVLFQKSFFTSLGCMMSIVVTSKLIEVTGLFPSRPSYYTRCECFEEAEEGDEVDDEGVELEGDTGETPVMVEQDSNKYKSLLRKLT